jgi:hypothetical protein
MTQEFAALIIAMALIVYLEIKVIKLTKEISSGKKIGDLLRKEIEILERQQSQNFEMFQLEFNHHKVTREERDKAESDLFGCQIERDRALGERDRAIYEKDKAQNKLHHLKIPNSKMSNGAKKK